MGVLWVSFRIHKDAGYDDRYAALRTTLITSVSGTWWEDSTSFFVLSSDKSISQLATAIKRVFGSHDLALVGSMTDMGATLVGPSNDLSSLRSLVPSLTTI